MTIHTAPKASIVGGRVAVFRDVIVPAPQGSRPERYAECLHFDYAGELCWDRVAEGDELLYLSEHIAHDDGTAVDDAC